MLRGWSSPQARGPRLDAGPCSSADRAPPGGVRLTGRPSLSGRSLGAARRWQGRDLRRRRRGSPSLGGRPSLGVFATFVGRPRGDGGERQQGGGGWSQQQQQSWGTPLPPQQQPQPAPPSAGGGLHVEQLVTMETNVDDMSPQIMAYTSEKLLAAGALDVWSTPAIMKKGRPGVILHVLCSRETVNALMTIIFYETTSLGVRVLPCERVSVQRVIESVSTPWGFVPVKAAFIQGELITATAEYEACAEIARRTNVPLKAIKAAAERSYIDSEAQERDSLLS